MFSELMSSDLNLYILLCKDLSESNSFKPLYFYLIPVQSPSPQKEDIKADVENIWEKRETLNRSIEAQGCRPLSALLSAAILWLPRAWQFKSSAPYLLQTKWMVPLNIWFWSCSAWLSIKMLIGIRVLASCVDWLTALWSCFHGGL